MGSVAEGSDLYLYYPQWQGCGDDHRVFYGAEILKKYFEETYNIQFAEVDVTNLEIDREDHSTDTTIDDVKESAALASNFLHAREYN